MWHVAVQSWSRHGPQSLQLGANIAPIAPNWHHHGSQRGINMAPRPCNLRPTSRPVPDPQTWNQDGPQNIQYYYTLCYSAGFCDQLGRQSWSLIFPGSVFFLAGSRYPMIRLIQVLLDFGWISERFSEDFRLTTVELWLMLNFVLNQLVSCIAGLLQCCFVGLLLCL